MSGFVSINLNKDFRRLYSRGKSIVTPYAVVYFCHNRQGVTRLGLTATKKLGNAVHRNRCRRLLKESFRSIAPRLNGCYDIVIVARGRLLNVKCDVVKDTLLNAFEKHDMVNRV